MKKSKIERLLLVKNSMLKDHLNILHGDFAGHKLLALTK